MQALDSHVKDHLKDRVLALENYFSGDCIFYYGLLYPPAEKKFREFY